MVPVPSSFSTSMLPPLAQTNFLHIDNPNPCPCALVVKKGSKIFGNICFLPFGKILLKSSTIIVHLFLERLVVETAIFVPKVVARYL